MRRRRGKYRAPSSRQEHFREALVQGERFADGWPDASPIHGWISAARTMAESKSISICSEHKTVDDDSQALAFLENTFLPAARLCRLVKSLRSLKRLSGSVELRQMRRNPEHFYHSDLMFYIGTRVALERRCEVRVVRTADKKTPDLEIPAQRVQSECKAHEVGTAMRSLRDDFESADNKLSDSLPPESAWTGLLAVDLGVCGHPSIPMLGKQGPDHTKQTQDAYKQFSSFPESRRSCSR